MVELLTDQLRLMASSYPDEIAYRNLGDDSAITFAHWERESNRLARGLQARGVHKGDLVAIYLVAEQILDWIVAYSAVHKAGAVAVPMNNRLSAAEVGAILEHAEVTAVVASDTFGATVSPLLDSLSSLEVAVSVGPPTPQRWVDIEAIKDPDGSEIQVPLGGDDLADVMYTSGTTGRPKGVAVRHGNYRHGAQLCDRPGRAPAGSPRRRCSPLPASGSSTTR